MATLRRERLDYTDFHIKGFLETSFSDWPGKICSMIFLPGCNFRCPYCHNHPLVLNPNSLLDIPFDIILARIKSFTGWVDGVCITGGEPLINPKILEIISIFRSEGIVVKIDTNGSQPEMLEKLLKNQALDFVSMDIKAPFNDVLYSKVVGVPISTDKIKRSFDVLNDSGVNFQIRTTIVPGILNEDDVLELAHHIKGTPRLTLQNFNPDNPLDPAFKKMAPMPEEDLRALQVKCNEIIGNT